MVSGSCVERKESKKENQGTKGAQDGIVSWNLDRLNLARFFILDELSDPRSEKVAARHGSSPSH